MMIPLVSFESLHEILRKLFDSMLPLCERMTVMASAIACIGALLYISYRVWQSIARAEPIDVFPLFKAVLLLKYHEEIHIFSAGTAINQAESFRTKKVA